MRIGALEGGGTKMVLAMVTETGEILDRVSIPTEAPEITVPKMIEYFKEQKPDALGIGFFGPLQLNKKVKNYGAMANTPKPGWKDYPLLATFQKELGIPIGLDTDVNAAALGEATFGCAMGLENCVYITIGTGIGIGVMSNGRLLHGMQHPEGGHILVKPHPEDTYKGHCPYHGTCFEGMAAGPAMEDRWGTKAYNLPADSKAWEFEAYYIAQGLVNIILMLSPEKIILGGGVMHQEHLLDMIREQTEKLLAGYIDTNETRDMENYIVPASLNDNQGILGSAKLGMIALEEAWGSLA